MGCNGPVPIGVCLHARRASVSIGTEACGSSTWFCVLAVLILELHMGLGFHLPEGVNPEPLNP